MRKRTTISASAQSASPIIQGVITRDCRLPKRVAASPYGEANG
jgi:hypothetical protein